MPRAKMAVLLAARRQELLINAKKARGARWEGVEPARESGSLGARRLPISPGLSPPPFFLPPTVHRCGFRIKSKIPIGDARSRSTLYIWPRDAFVGTNRPSTTPRLASLHHADNNLARKGCLFASTVP